MKKFLKKENTLYIIFTLILTLIIFLSLFNKNQYTFFLISILANLFLIIILKETFQRLNIKFKKIQKITIIISTIIVYLFYIISIYKRNFIYYWDYSCYYNIQVNTMNKFLINLFEGIKYFLSSTWSGEYGNFLSFFPQIIFQFTNKTIDSYLLSCIVIYTPYILITLSALLNKINEKFNLTNFNYIYIMTIISFILFPILHATAIYSQPDYFGLVFIFLIITLTIDYNFEKLEWDRLILILLVTLMLIISRRWYLYWVITYYLCYIIKIFITNKNKDLKQIIKNIFIYGLVVIIVLAITLLPLFINILSSNITNYQEFYSGGGFFAELKNQINYIGYLQLSFILIGIIYGLKAKKYRLLTILSIVQYLLIVFLFTNLQAMGLHHSLMLVPIYLYDLYLFIVGILTIKELSNNRICILILSCLLVNFIYGISNNQEDKLFTKVSLTVPHQEDYKELGEVADWLKENLNDQETAYMITHTNKYNPDKLRNYYLPDQTIAKYLPYGSAVIGVHKFPLELFTAKYIIITSPFESISVEEKYYEVFMTLVEQKTFEIVKEFNMKNNYKIIIYKRITEASQQEKELYIKNLTEESNKYPNLYKNIIESYKVN